MIPNTEAPATAPVKPPLYLSNEYQQYPEGHPMRVESLKHSARCWAYLNSSPHLQDLLSDFEEWMSRRDWSESTALMSAQYDWSKEAYKPTYAELKRRRAVYTTEPKTPAQIRAQASQSWARFDNVTDIRRAA